MTRRATHFVGALSLLVTASLCLACDPRPPAADPSAAPDRSMSHPAKRVASLEFPPPAAAGAMAPNLAMAGEAVLLTWLEPASQAGEGHRLRVSRLGGGTWSPAVTIAEGGDFFANWADFPSLTVIGDGSLLAHWLLKTGPDPYAYSIELARSPDGGATWEAVGRLNNDNTQTEHGFVSFTPRGGGVQAFWLDGREMPGGGTMTLRTELVGGRPRGRQRVLDPRVCECCQTSAAWTHQGPVVVYRDRSPDEVRDIAIVRMTHRGWTEPRPVHTDGWWIPGCPVNGPAVAADEELVVVAWFTGAAKRPRVQVAFSEDSGASFHPPVVVDGETPLGRVGVSLDGPETAIVSWLAATGQGAEIRLRRVTRQGHIGEAVAVIGTTAARASGFPRIGAAGGRLFMVWVDISEERASRLRFVELPMERVPSPQMR